MYSVPSTGLFALQTLTHSVPQPPHDVSPVLTVPSSPQALEINLFLSNHDQEIRLRKGLRAMISGSLLISASITLVSQHCASTWLSAL